MAGKEQDFETRLKRLESIVTRLEDQDLPLEKGVALFKEGVELAKSCRKQLEDARNTVQIYVKGVLEDFELDQPLEMTDDMRDEDDEGSAQEV